MLQYISIESLTLAQIVQVTQDLQDLLGDYEISHYAYDPHSTTADLAEFLSGDRFLVSDSENIFAIDTTQDDWQAFYFPDQADDEIEGEKDFSRTSINDLARHSVVLQNCIKALALECLEIVNPFPFTLRFE